MAFIYKGSLNPNGGRILKKYYIASGQTVTVGDCVALTGDALTCQLIAGGGSVLGIVDSIILADGSPPTSNGAGSDYTNTVTTASATSHYAVVDISRESIYSVTADATLGTTAGSDMIGYKLDCVAASDQLDESSAATTTASFVSHGQDPDGTAADNSLLVTIYESIFWHIA